MDNFLHPGDPIQYTPVAMEPIPRPIEEFRALCDLTLELTRLRQNECKHLCVENVAPEILNNLLRAAYAFPIMQAHSATAKAPE